MYDFGHSPSQEVTIDVCSRSLMDKISVCGTGAPGSTPGESTDSISETQTLFCNGNFSSFIRADVVMEFPLPYLIVFKFPILSRGNGP